MKLKMGKQLEQKENQPFSHSNDLWNNVNEEYK